MHSKKIYKNTKLPPVFVLGSALSISRALNKYGIPVYCSDPGFIVDRFSNRVYKPSFGWRAEYNAALLDKLIKFSQECFDKPILMPSTDVAIEFIMNYYNKLIPYFKVAKIYLPEVGSLFLYKNNFYNICARLGIEYPATYMIKNEDDLYNALYNLRYPVIIKPNAIHKWKKYLKGNKVIKIDNLEQFRELKFLNRDLLRDSMIQEVIPGPESNIYLFKGCIDNSGELIDFFTGRKLRQFPPHFGSASLAETKLIPEIVDICKYLFSKIKIQGLVGAEFKYDWRDKKYKMIEINIRVQLWEDLMRVSGKEIIWNHYCDLIGKKNYIVKPQIDEIKWIHFNRDIFSALYYLMNKDLNINDLIRSYKKIRVDALMQLSDPLTIIGSIIYSINQIINYKLKPGS